MANFRFSRLMAQLTKFSSTAQRRDKLEKMMQTGNNIRRAGQYGSAAKTYKICEVDGIAGRAMLMSEDETEYFALMFINDFGSLRLDLADAWELVVYPTYGSMASYSVEPSGRFNREYLAALGK